jgi:nucleotide-binding universal stress UspA family protein
MTYRDIFVIMDPTEAAAQRAALAAQLAGRLAPGLDATLTGGFLKSDILKNMLAVEAFGYMNPQDIEDAIKGHETETVKAAEAARMVLENAATEGGAASRWCVLDGDSDEAVVAYARRKDLTVLSAAAQAYMGEHRIGAARLSMAVGGPVIVIPDKPAPQLGERVLVAWNGSREAARALRDAWPILEAAKDVQVLVVSPRGEGGPDGLLQRHLERHGLKCELIEDRSEDDSAGFVIRKHAQALNIDLIVMGLYGRPRLSELVLGGVSQDMLDAPPAALLMSH